MKKISKIIGTIVLSSMLLVTSTVFAYSTNYQSTNFDIVKAKHDLVNKYKSNNSSMRLTAAQDKARSDKADKMLNQLLLEGKTQSEIDNEMAKLGIYRLEVPKELTNQNTITLNSQPGDATVDGVTFYYDSYNSQWIASTAGRWNTRNWYYDKDQDYTFNDVGGTSNVGGRDAVGITYFNTYGQYGNDVTVLGSWGAFSCSDGTRTQYNQNPSQPNGKFGVAFEIQDKIIITNSPGIIVDASDVDYIGSNFTCSIRYNNRFVDYNGKARGYYVHTWKNSYINSISINAGADSFGVGFSIANENNAFKMFTQYDSPF